MQGLTCFSSRAPTLTFNICKGLCNHKTLSQRKSGGEASEMLVLMLLPLGDTYQRLVPGVVLLRDTLAQ